MRHLLIFLSFSVLVFNSIAQNNEKPTYTFTVRAFIDKQTADYRGGEKAIKLLILETFKRINTTYNTQTVPLDAYYNFSVDTSQVVIYDMSRSAIKQTIPDRNQRDYDYAVVFDGLRNFDEESVSSAGTAGMGLDQKVSIHRSATTFSSTFPEGAYGTCVHELGHLRGCRDLYPYDVAVADNPINGTSFKAIACVMGSSSGGQFCDYNQWILNMSKDKMVSSSNKNVVGDPRWIIDNTMYPDSVKILCRRGFEPVKAKIKIYHFLSGEYQPDYFYEKESDNNGNLLTTYKDIFFRSGTEIGRPTLLVECTDILTNEKSYSWMTKYDVERSKVVFGRNIHIQINAFHRDKAQRVYVSSDGTGTGSSWADAAKFEPSILNLLISGDEVWIKKGIYNLNIYAESVSIYGGFSGTETLLSERDFENNKTIIDGTGIKATLVEQTSSGDFLLDGFTIQNGNAGGVKLASKGAIRNCIIQNNKISGTNAVGGGVFADNMNTGSGIIENCLIINNEAEYNGGGIGFGATASNSLKIINTTIANNKITGSTSGYGAGVGFPVSNYCSLTVQNSIFFNNQNSVGTVSSIGTNTLTKQGAVFMNNCAFDGVIQNFQIFTKTACITDLSPSNTPQFESPTEFAGTTSDMSLFDGSSFMLKNSSPCIDAGNNFFCTSATDLNFNNRKVGAAIDMGAYEYSVNNGLKEKYSNPCKMAVQNDVLTIELLRGNEIVSVYDISGKEVYSGRSLNNSIAVSFKSKGVYIILVDNVASKVLNK